MNRPSVHTVCQFIFIFYKSGRYDLLCNSLYNATYRKQNKTTTKKKRKQYKWNCTKQHRAINNPYNNNIFHIFEVFPLPNPGDPPSVRSQLLLEGDWASFILRLFFFFWVWLIKLCLLKKMSGVSCSVAGFYQIGNRTEKNKRQRFGKLFTYNQPSGLGCFLIK